MNGNSAVYAAIVFALGLWPLILVGHLLFCWIMVRMARRRGLGGWPLGWIPMMNLWVMGSLCDQYQYVVHGKRSHNRVWLPILAIALEVLLVFGVLGVQGRPGFLPALWATLLDVTVALILVRLWLCLYRLYLSCVPRRAVGWMVWSVCVPFLPLVFLLLCKNKEQGMPARRVMFRQPVTVPPAEVPEEVAVPEETTVLEEAGESATPEEAGVPENEADAEAQETAPEAVTAAADTQEERQEREEVGLDG